MQKILISLPDDLAQRMRMLIPARKRSGVIADLLESEIHKREQSLYRCAHEVENDFNLNQEMSDWEETVGDGLESETW